MWNQPAFWSFILNIIILIVSVSGFIKIMKNDLCHVQKKLDDIATDVKTMNKEIGKLGERVAHLEGKHNGNTKT